jgi:ABC-type branched-subunit amino acid transport system ATPase component
MTAIIEVENVTKTYGGVVANKDISLAVERGSITGLIGPNGSGKTTMFNSIVGFHPIDAGSRGARSAGCACPRSRASACCAPSSRRASTGG